MNAQSRNASPIPPAGWGAVPTHQGDILPGPVAEGRGSEGPGAQVGDRNVELWLGRYAIGVIAAVLVFLGAACFAVALVPHLSDVAKMAVMFAVSIVLTATGSALAVRRPNGFTMALMGCGAGSLFISVLVSRLYFGMLDELAALGLILAWMLMCLALIRKTQSLLLDIVLQLGLAVSVCMGLASGFDSGRLWLLVGYQLVASIVVVGGNLMFCRKMYRSSLVLALSLSIVVTLFVWDYCGQLGFHLFSLESEHPVGFVAAALSVQLLSATAFAACLAHSVLAGIAGVSQSVPGAQAGAEGASGISRRRASALLIAGAVLWANAVRLDCHFAVTYCLRNLEAAGFSAYAAYAAGTVAMVALVAGACLALMAYGRMCGVGAGEAPLRPALTVLEWAGAVAALLGSFNMACADDVLPVGFLWAWAIFVAALGYRLGGQRFVVLTVTCLALETAIVCFGLFPGLPGRFGYAAAMAIGAMHMLTLCGLTGVLLYLLGWKRGNAVALALVSTVFVMSYVSYCLPIHVEGWMLSVCGMVCALIWVVLGFAMSHDQLRLCGLVVVLLCVAKLVVVDLAGLDPMSRTIAYVGGGLICFAVSALYNFATHRVADARGDGR